jgi:hypothetical protein
MRHNLANRRGGRREKSSKIGVWRPKITDASENVVQSISPCKSYCYAENNILVGAGGPANLRNRPDFPQSGCGIAANLIGGRHWHSDE